jgi:hypothetical protein
VIQEKTHSNQEIRTRWFNAINSKLTDDKIASRIRRNRGLTNLVINTWEQVLSKERDLPNEWINMREVLVVGPALRRNPKAHAIPNRMCVNTVNTFSLTQG